MPERPPRDEPLDLPEREPDERDVARDDEPERPDERLAPDEDFDERDFVFERVAFDLPRDLLEDLERLALAELLDDDFLPLRL
ncbi:hypothetical protein JYU19_00285 [bacterium AH-315-J21]|nr:hypothetical protein [bacterium AH-315-J21]